MNHPLLLAAVSVLLVPSLHAQGTTPPGITAALSTREVWSQTYVFEAPLSENEEIMDTAPNPFGPWLVDLDLNTADPTGIPVGRARSRQDSDVQRTELSFDLDLSMTTTGNHAQEDATGFSTYRIQFSTAERMRFTFAAQTAATQGYNYASVDIHAALTPTAPIASVVSPGVLDSSSSGYSDGWLQPGDYVLYANCSALAGGGGAGPAASEAASCSGAMQFFHECDFDLDGDVDAVDRQLFLMEWFVGQNIAATDMDGDGDRDVNDARTFIQRWRRALRP